ncbi:MAG: UDP-N-acetylmuramyl-tripeptide synthetase, partial [Pirellulaceae bacterium]|nr:UDP-N-acetylmuramyl-tripeptide synthetase [Pirellulaceae bacterium]
TTPAPPVLAKWMSRMVGNGCGSAILELSSEALAQRRLAGVQLDAAVLTNVRRDHLEFHGSQLNYRNAKARLFNHLKETSGVSVLNVDDAGSQSLLGKTAGAVMTVGMHEQAELMATVVERYAGEQTFLLTAGNETAAVRTRMIGDQHVYNCLSAAAVGLVAGLDLATVVKGIEAVEMVPGRLQRIECGQPFAVYVDYARTPDSLSLCLSTIRKVTDGRLIVVYGAEGDRSGENRPRLGRAAERYADTTIITGHNPRHEEPLQIVHDILDGYDDPARAHAIPNRQRAIEFALSRARSGDAVIIAGKGHEDWQIVGSRKRKFSDADTARKWLYESVADQVDAIPFPRWKRSA